MFQKTLTIHVDFPALDNLVAFLRDNQQSKIDATTAAIEQLTTRLGKSGVALENEITKEQ